MCIYLRNAIANLKQRNCYAWYDWASAQIGVNYATVHATVHATLLADSLAYVA